MFWNVPKTTLGTVKSVSNSARNVCGSCPASDMYPQYRTPTDSMTKSVGVLPLWSEDWPPSCGRSPQGKGPLRWTPASAARFEKLYSLSKAIHSFFKLRCAHQTTPCPSEITPAAVHHYLLHQQPIIPYLVLDCCERRLPSSLRKE